MIITDDILKEFLVLEHVLKLTLKRSGEIKEAIKQKGSFYTEKYVCSVTDHSRIGLVGLEEMVRHIEREALEARGLIKLSRFKMVKVSPVAENIEKELKL